TRRRTRGARTTAPPPWSRGTRGASPFRLLRLQRLGLRFLLTHGVALHLLWRLGEEVQKARRLRRHVAHAAAVADDLAVVLLHVLDGGGPAARRVRPVAARRRR